MNRGLSRRDFTRMSMGFCLLSGHVMAKSFAEKRPNILLIVTDDQGYGDIHSHGNSRIDTPTMDQLARDGARFERFFVSPSCAPTRASLLTGRYHLRTGTTWVSRNREAMRSEEITIAEVLKKAGYVTGCFGKWHNGAHYPEHPNAQGFDEFYGFCGGVTSNYFDAELENNGKVVHSRGYIADVLTDRAIQFIRNGRNRPFFCYIPYNTPHTPCQVPDRYFDKYKSRGFDTHTASVYGMIENIDDNMERILRSLSELGLDESTVVIFLGDNGPNGNRFNSGMRGRKGSLDEGGVRVPLFIRWPGHIKPDTVIKENAAHIDILPTIMDICRIDQVDTKPIDGKSLGPLMLGKGGEWPDRIIYSFPVSREGVHTANGAARTQKWRAIKRNNNWELYDIDSDPGQQKNVALLFPWILEKLSSDYEKKFKEVVDEGGGDRLPIQIGHRASPSVLLPAHEADLVPGMDKGIGYHYNPGYTGSFITNWTDSNACALWPIKVVRGGEFDVTLWHTCEKKNIGVWIRVEVGEEAIEGAIDTAHDPQPIPAPFRLEKEAYKYLRKPWKKIMLGRFFLQKGTADLIVRSLKIPGEKSIELKAVEMTLVGD